LQNAGKTVEGENLDGVAGAGIIGEYGEEAEGGRLGKIQLFEADGNFGGEDRAG
jgi:hypothetical protein